MNHTGTRLDKGKRRAINDPEDPTESTPLLGSSVEQPQLISLESSPLDHWEIDWTAVIRALFYGVLLVLIVFMGLLAYAVSQLRKDIKLNDAVPWELRDFQVLNITFGEDGGLPSMTAKAEALVGGLDMGDLPAWEQKLATWGIRTMDTVRIATSPVTAMICTPNGPEEVASVTVKPFEFKLPTNAADKQRVTVEAKVEPNSTPSRMLQILEYTWGEQRVKATAIVHNIHVEGTHGWRKLINLTLKVLKLPLQFRRECIFIRHIDN
jgi:hypothetical protein